MNQLLTRVLTDLTERTSRSVNMVSNPLVAAAVITRSERVYWGNNIYLSHASMSCAEANAYASAVAAGDTDVVTVMITSSRRDGAKPSILWPCGTCRQLFSDVAALTGNLIAVYSADPDKVLGRALTTLIPEPFIPTRLAKLAAGEAR